jgi:hypothetical protein
MSEDQLREGGGRGLFTLKNLLLLLAGFVLGYIIKGQAVQNVTMGYDDYKIIVNEKQIKEIDINKLEESTSGNEEIIKMEEENLNE